MDHIQTVSQGVRWVTSTQSPTQKIRIDNHLPSAGQIKIKNQSKWGAFELWEEANGENLFRHEDKTAAPQKKKTAEI